MMLSFIEFIKRLFLRSTSEATASVTVQGSANTMMTCTEVLALDSELLKRFQMQWSQGDLRSLALLEESDLITHPDYADLLLLAAAGRFYRGDTNEANDLIKKATKRGCDRELLSRVLVSSTYLSIGRAALHSGSSYKANKYFLASASVEDSRTETVKHQVEGRLDAESERSKQLLSMRLQLARQGGNSFASDLADKSAGSSIVVQDATAYAINPLFSSTAYNYYRSLSDLKGESKFLLIDSKSLPRSGLHYLKNTLVRVLPGHFSFCEWYQEPGCCKRMPCALTAYAEASCDQNINKVRLLKSHDFDLSDPAFSVDSSLHRLVLIRDPLFVLTSWFVLDRLSANKDVLLDHGLDMKKVWLSHEPEVVAQAIRLLDDIYKPIDPEELKIWLLNRIRYISGFLKRWAYPALRDPRLGWRVVAYEQINTYLLGLLLPLRGQLSSDAEAQVARFIESQANNFDPRQDAFKLKSSKLTEDVTRHASLFKAASNDIALTNDYLEMVRQLEGREVI